MAHKQSGELKKRAQLAKQRLKMGYFESAHGETEFHDDTNVGYTASYAHFADTTTNRDEKMYKKVCAMLDRDEATLNPIGQLIESDVYSALDAAAKQRYILELSNKFRELKERYYRERAKTS